MLSILLCSMCECGPAEAWIKEHSQASPPVCLCFVLRPGSGTVDVCMFLVHLFDGKGTFLLSDSDVGSAAWLPVLLDGITRPSIFWDWCWANAGCWRFCGLVVVFSSWHAPIRIFNGWVQALIRCIAVRFAQFVGPHPRFWLTVQALQARPALHVFSGLDLVVLLLLVEVCVVKTCAQALVHCADVRCARLVEPHPDFCLLYMPCRLDPLCTYSADWIGWRCCWVCKYAWFGPVCKRSTTAPLCVVRGRVPFSVYCAGPPG